MTGLLTKTKVKTEDLRVGNIARKQVANKDVDFIILAIAPSRPGERDFTLKVAAPTNEFLKPPHSCYAFKDEYWEIVGQADVDKYWEELNKKKPIELDRRALSSYLEDYNKRNPPLKQLTLAENDARIESYKTRDWWGNELTSPDESEHLWNLYQREEMPSYKHFYLKMFAQSKGVKLPPYERHSWGFPMFTEEQIKELEKLHEQTN